MASGCPPSAPTSASASGSNPGLSGSETPLREDDGGSARDQGVARGKGKLAGYDFYRSIGSPKRIVAPMVDQSELAWRILSRHYATDLVYTPMINAKLFADNNPKYRRENFDVEAGEEGGQGDRPLIVQFCANDPDQLLTAAKVVEAHCDAVDLNLGCPQHIAKRGFYGAFLQEDWDLIYRLINTLHKNLSIPVTAKFRCFDTVEKTVEYAKMIESAGAQILTVHGRTREMKGHNTGLADWNKIAAVKKAVKVPVFANGNILFGEDVQRCLDETGVDGVMSAEGNLYNPAIFTNTHPSISCLANEYLDIVASLKTRTPGSAIKAHLFKIFRPALGKHKDLREELGRCTGSRGDVEGEERVKAWRAIVKEFERRLEVDKQQPTTSGKIPHWLAQPYFRPLPVSGGSAQGAEVPKAVVADGKEENMVDPADVQARGEAVVVREGEEVTGSFHTDGHTSRPLGTLKRTASQLSDAEVEEDADGGRSSARARPCAGHPRLNKPCPNMASANCSRGELCKACCREVGRLALEEREDSDQARRETSVQGAAGEEGLGCEAHESKERARRERERERREMKARTKAERKAKATEAQTEAKRRKKDKRKERNREQEGREDAQGDGFVGNAVEVVAGGEMGPASTPMAA